ncbi:MAG: hypothetical protein K940chlam7_00512 [Chlamydiae bacterium]|nr:hypothetical protein [Chlamydiota bacterium]
MDVDKPLSPCVHSAMRSLPESVTSWEFAKYLLRIHPEYSKKNHMSTNLSPTSRRLTKR